MTDRSSVLDDLFRQYLTHQQAFLTVAERCSIKGWPDRKPSLLNAWRLQCLYNERHALRFEYLLRRGFFQQASWESMSRVSDRILENWSDAEEQALSEGNLRYRALPDEIAACLAALEGDAIQEPFEAARRDPEYAAALLALQDGWAAPVTLNPRRCPSDRVAMRNRRPLRGADSIAAMLLFSADADTARTESSTSERVGAVPCRRIGSSFSAGASHRVGVEHLDRSWPGGSWDSLLC